MKNKKQITRKSIFTKARRDIDRDCVRRCNAVDIEESDLDKSKKLNC